MGVQIIFEINFVHLECLKKEIGSDFARLARMSIIEEGEHKAVRMASLALVASHTVNGVAKIHSENIKTTLFKDFHAVWPQKFQNKTNGVTPVHTPPPPPIPPSPIHHSPSSLPLLLLPLVPTLQRRWLSLCNPALGVVLTRWLGTHSWVTDLDLLAGLRRHCDNPDLHTEWRAVRRQNKARLGAYIEEVTGVGVSIDAMFDVQVKRIHEYKRQLLNVVGIIHRYTCIKVNSRSQGGRKTTTTPPDIFSPLSPFRT